METNHAPHTKYCRNIITESLVRTLMSIGITPTSDAGVAISLRRGLSRLGFDIH